MCSECTPWRNSFCTSLWQCTPPLHAVTISLLPIDSDLCMTVVSTLVSVTPSSLPPSVPALVAQSRQERLVRCFWHKVGQSSHAEAGLSETSDKKEEGVKEADW